MVEFAGEQAVMIKGGGEDLEQTDYELVKICLSGKRDTFSEIVTRYKRLVYATIYNFMGNSPDVSDLFQEVFLKVYKSLASYNPRLSVFYLGGQDCYQCVSGPAAAEEN